MNFDIAIIGGGPAGYTAAERAGANGLKAVLFEKKAMGGVCLNEGCIPTKTLLYSAKILDSIKSASKYGVSAESPSFDLSKIMNRKDKTVKMLTGGVKMTVNSYGVTIVEKEAFIEGENEGMIRITCDGETYSVKYLLVCTGSDTVIPPIPGLSGVSYWTSKEALEIKELPKTLVIIGGGVIGMEFASFFNSMGVKVPGVPTELPTVVPGAKYGEDESFFDDALFIGDSRMVSSAYYARLGKADYFTDVGMNVFQMFSVTASDNNFDTTDLKSLLQNRTYKKIFIMLGINECGYPMSSLLSAYQEDIDTLKSLQPDATIYLLKVYGVSRSVAESASYFSPQRLQEVNDGVAGLADGKKVHCLDASHLYCDDEGYMKEEYTSDGVHPYAKDAALFAQWLCQQISGGR